MTERRSTLQLTLVGLILIVSLPMPVITTNFWERFTNCADSTQVCIARGLLGSWECQPHSPRHI